MYFLYLNGTLIASLGPSVRNDTRMLNLQRDTEYNYSVVAMSCAGNSTHTYADTISIGNPPSSPVVTTSQTDTSCSNVLTWPSPASDRSVTSYSISRDGSIADNVPHTATAYTDSYELDIDTAYRYSVVAISCAGSSTSTDVYSPKIERTSLATNPPLTIRYDNTTNELFVDWTLNPSQLISVTYNLSLVYNYTQNNETLPYDETEIFSQISTNTNNTQSLIRPTFLSTNESVEFVLTAKLSITQQCNTIITDGIELTFIITTEFTPSTTTTFPVGSIIGIVAGLCGGLTGVTGVTIVIKVYVSKKKGKVYNTKSRSDSQELTKSDTIKKHEPIEETQVHAIGGPNQ